MIRWYDYAVAIIVADALFTIATGMFTADIWGKVVMNAISLSGWLIIWDIYYTNFRIKQENKRSS